LLGSVGCDPPRLPVSDGHQGKIESEHYRRRWQRQPPAQHLHDSQQTLTTMRRSALAAVRSPYMTRPGFGGLLRAQSGSVAKR